MTSFYNCVIIVSLICLFESMTPLYGLIERYSSMELNCTTTSKELFYWSRGKDSLTIAGVFSGGVYFLRSDGQMLLLHDRESGTLPFGFQADGILGRGKELGFEPKKTLLVNDGMIWQPETEIRLYLHYAPTELIKSAVSPEQAWEWLCTEGLRHLSEKGGTTLVPFAERASDSFSRSELKDPFAAAGWNGVQALELGLKKNDGKRISDGLMGLIGLGQGLTPTFDDFITGIILSLNYASHCWKLVHPALEILREKVLALAPARTNPYSAVYLTAAAKDGRFSLVDEYLNTIGTNEWASSADRLLQVGSSSGADMTAGILFAERLIKIEFAEK